MERKHGPWTIKETDLKYQNEFVQVYQDIIIRPDGEPGVYTTVAMKPGVAVLAMDDIGQVYLTSQFRYTLGEESLEVVSGVIEKGESRLEAARRELSEELGIVADELIDLGKIFIDTSIIKAPVWLFLARDLTFADPHPVGSEKIKSVRMKIDEAVTAVVEGRIVHAPSCILILKIIQNSRLQ